MNKMLALIRNENMKIYRRGRTWVIAGMVAGMLLMMAILMVRVDAGSVDHMLDFAKIGVNMTSLATAFTVVIASDSVASEFSWGTIKLLLIRPAKRWKILLSKYTASLLFAVFLLLVNFAASLVFGLLFFGTDGTVNPDSTPADILREYGFQAVQLVMIVTLSFMISTVFRSNVLAIVLAVVILFAGSTISGLLVALDQEWAKYSLFLNMNLSMYYGEQAVPPFPGMTPAFSAAVLLVHFLVFHAVSFWLFTKRDVAF